MPTMYAKCNWMLSLALDENGQPCRYTAIHETEQDVVDDMSKHVQRVHSVEPADIINNIRGVTKTVRTKSLGTRPPGGH